MTLRIIAAVIAGVLVWSVLFMVVGIAIGLAWPDYRAAARLFFDDQDFGLFTVPMMLTNFVVFAIAGLATGWIVTRLGASRKAGSILAGLCLLYGLVEHYYLLWDVIPAWYNLVVPWIMAGSIYAGSRLAAEKPAS